MQGIQLSICAEVFSVSHISLIFLSKYTLYQKENIALKLDLPQLCPFLPQQAAWAFHGSQRHAP